MEMSANSRAEVEFEKERQHIVSVERTHGNVGAKGEMGENDRRLAGVKPGKTLSQPGKGFRRDLRIPPSITRGRVDADQLPTAVFNDVVDLVLECSLIRAPVRVRQIIVISDGGVDRKTEAGESRAHTAVLASFTLVREIAAKQTELGVRRTLLHCENGFFKPSSAFLLIRKVKVVHREEAEGFSTLQIARPQPTRPHTEAQQCPGT